MSTKALQHLVLSVVLAVGLCGISAILPATQAYASPEHPAQVATPSSAQKQALKKASADFSLELFQRCVADKGKNANVTVSPMSVMNALAVTANGANGTTADQMREVLGDGASMASINKYLSWYNSRLVNTGKAKLNNANAIWYSNDKSLKVKKPFLSKAKKDYKAKVTSADF